MEYLVYLGFFAGGWILSKFDTTSRIKAKLGKYTEEVFTAGVQAGHKLTIEHMEKNGESVTMGFQVTNIKKDDNNDY